MKQNETLNYYKMKRILESFDNKIGLLVEQAHDINERLNSQSATMAAFASQVNTNLEDMKQRLARIEGKIP